MTVVAAVLGWLLEVLVFLIAHPWTGVPVAIVAWLMLVLVFPYRACRWCRPGGLLGGSLIARLARRKPKPRRRSRRCRRCKGTKMTRRLGARQVHRTKVVLAQQWDEWRNG